MTTRSKRSSRFEQFGAEPADIGADHGRLEKRFLRLQLGGLDPLGNFDFLFAREQRDLAHLLEIHPNRIVQDVVLRRAGLLLLRFLLPLLVILDLVRLENLDLEILQNREDVIDFLLVFDRLGQRLVDVVERQIPLLLRETDEVTNLVVDPASGNVFSAR